MMDLGKVQWQKNIIQDKVEDHYWIADNLQDNEFVIRVGGEETNSSKKEVDRTLMEALAVMESSIFVQVCSSLHSLMSVSPCNISLMHAFIPIHGYVSPSIRPHTQSASLCTHVFDGLFALLCTHPHTCLMYVCPCV